MTNKQRRWDIESGETVRVLLCEGVVKCLCFEHNGRHLASGGTSARKVGDGGEVVVYDVVHAAAVRRIGRREGTVYSLDVSQEDAVLAVGYANSKVELVDLVKVKKEAEEVLNDAGNSDRYILNTYKTKQTSVLCVKFTYENLLLAIASFAPETR